MQKCVNLFYLKYYNYYLQSEIISILQNTNRKTSFLLTQNKQFMSLH